MHLNFAFRKSTQCAPIPFHFPYGENLCEVDMKQVETLYFNEIAPILMRERDREMFWGLIIGCVKRLNFIHLKRARHRGWGWGVRHNSFLLK